MAICRMRVCLRVRKVTIINQAVEARVSGVGGVPRRPPGPLPRAVSAGGGGAKEVQKVPLPPRRPQPPPQRQVDTGAG